uniref:Uncharacterized protein n=1 Tax=Cyclophora tenuis TaxID=216820 RepID=A0A7S1D6E3_CYCTE|mmetsp:Transcript_2332/g.4017  ORF Transcript_2332/g.4017 Transcript_2332/m.4017 type:complete len:109 (+) Transcript_2332:11-337(+)
MQYGNGTYRAHLFRLQWKKKTGNRKNDGRNEDVGKMSRALSVILCLPLEKLSQSCCPPSSDDDDDDDDGHAGMFSCSQANKDQPKRVETSFDIDFFFHFHGGRDLVPK